MKLNQDLPILAFPSKYKYLTLIFISFYFIRWFWPMPPHEWVINIASLLLFFPLYFLGFKGPRYAVICGILLVVMGIMVLPYNYGACCFTIYGCNYFSHTLNVRNVFISVISAVTLTCGAMFYFDVPLIPNIFIVTLLPISMAGYAIFDRQNYRQQLREAKNLDEVQRLAQIAERERIGQDLHDLLGHTLTVIHLKAQLAGQLLQKNSHEQAREEIASIQQVAEQSLKEVRQAVTGYKSHNLAEEIQAQSSFLQSMGVQFTHELPQTIIAPIIEGHLIMIVREALTNVLRHSKAKSCSVHLNALDQHLILQIEDDGQGFDPNTTHDGNGLNGIQERCEQLGGSVTISSPPGFKLTISIPWKAPNE